MLVRNATTDDSEESVIDKLDKINKILSLTLIISFLNKAISKHHHLIKTKITKKNLVRQQINPIVIVKTIKVMMVVAQH